MIREIRGMIFTVAAEDGYAQPGRGSNSQWRPSGAGNVPLRARQDGRPQKPYGHSGHLGIPAHLRKPHRCGARVA
jgi:hypothetical protein